VSRIPLPHEESRRINTVKVRFLAPSEAQCCVPTSVPSSVQRVKNRDFTRDKFSYLTAQNAAPAYKQDELKFNTNQWCAILLLCIRLCSLPCRFEAILQRNCAAREQNRVQDEPLFSSFSKDRVRMREFASYVRR
jgi:hypothetical protein